MQGMKETKPCFVGAMPLQNVLFKYVKIIANYCLKSSLFIASLIVVMGLLHFYAKAQDKTIILSNSKTTINYTTAYTPEEKGLSLFRLNIDWSGKVRLPSNWTANLELSATFADDDVGLGTSNTFAKYNQEIIDNEHVRLAVNQFVFTWRKGKNTFDLGKQYVPWGVLDGVQVTDRFDPVRRRDFVFAEFKPERLARWGARWRTKVANWSLDSAFVFDGTVSQLANFGDEFQFNAPRYLAGLDLSQLNSDTRLGLYNEERDHSVAQSTLGVRLSRYIGSGELSFIGFRGPDTEPVLSIEAPSNKVLPVKLDYIRRSLIGLNYDFSHGPVVWRIEAAYIPDQSLNIKSEQQTAIEKAARSLIGLGIDWQASHQIFINAQVVVDYISLSEQLLFRPKTDSVMTLRIQRPFLNERLLIKSELIASLNQRDGIVRPGFIFELNDNSKLKGGIDWAFGDRQGQFGQFRDASRVWLGYAYSF